MLCESFSGLHGMHLQILGPFTRLKLKAFDLQQFWKLFRHSSTVQPQSSDLRTSSSLHQVLEDPSYTAVRHAQTTVSITSRPASQLENLPSELQLMIMSRLGDVNTLRSLSLSSKIFNRLHIEHQKTVLPAVLAEEIHQSVFEEAFWAVQAAQQGFDRHNFVSKLSDFIADWDEIEPGSPKPRDVPLTDLLQISHLHGHVSALIEDFCAYALSGPMAPSPPQAHPPQISTMEFSRIARAFYRFEFYCNLYTDHPLAENLPLQELIRAPSDFEVRANSYKLFDYWDAWATEGVACIRDYFCARLTDVFANIQLAAAENALQVHIYFPWDLPDVIKAHIPDIPENHVYFRDDLVPSWYDETAPSGASFLRRGCETKRLKELFMSRGLEFLCQLLTASSGYEQYQMFQSIMHDIARSACESHFITHALRQYPACMQEQGETIEAFCHRDDQKFLGDIHPAAPNFAWTWANEGKFQPFYAEDRTEYLRSLGYVMWDQERLLRVSLFRRAPLQQKDCYAEPSHRAVIAEHETKCARRISGADNSLDDSALPASQESQTQLDGGISDDELELSYQNWEDVPLLASSANVEVTLGQSNESAQEDTTALSQACPIWKDDDHAVSLQNSEDASSSTLSTALEARNSPDNQLGADRTGALPLTTEDLAPASQINMPPQDLLEEDDVSRPPKDETDTDVGNRSADQNGPQAKHIFKQPLERKIARAISPRAKFLKLQQEAAQEIEYSPSKLTVEKPLASSFCAMLDSTGIHQCAPSPPSSNCSSSIPESGRSMKSKASSTTSSELFVADNATLSQNTHAESNNMIVTGTKSTEDTTRLYLSSKAPSDVAAWIEGSNFGKPLHSLTPSSSPSPSIGPVGGGSDSSNMGVNSTNTNTNLTKQQRKKANRKARKAEAATETTPGNAIRAPAQQTNGTEIERASEEQGRKKEYQTEYVEKTITTTKAEEERPEVVGSNSNGGEKMGHLKTKKTGKSKAKKEQKRKTVGYLIG